MALDPSYTGRTYPPTSVYEVGREKIREFAEAIGDANPLYRDPEAARAAGHRDVLAPPTFPFAISWPAVKQLIDDPQMGIDFSRVLHAEQRFVYSRPVYAGDRLVATLVVEDISERAGQGFVSARVDLADAEGEPVVAVISRLVVTSADAAPGGEA